MAYGILKVLLVLALRSDAVRREMGRLFLQKLEGRCYACVYCGCHLANSCDLLSRVLAFPSASSNGMVLLRQAFS